MYTAFYVLVALICAVLFAKAAEAVVIFTKSFFKRVRG